MTTLLELEQAQEGLKRHASTPAAKQWSAEEDRLRQIERLEACIVYQYEIDGRSMERDSFDAFCSEECSDKGNKAGHEYIQGTARDLAIKIQALDWIVTDQKRFWLLCPVCREGKPEDESSWAAQYQDGNGGIL